MKKLLLTLNTLLLVGTAVAQLPVSTAPSNKKAVLEEFTGITCTFCPQGHSIANTISAANPGDFFQVNIHTGSYAVPTGPGTDFRTADGTAIANQAGMGITGYPTGAINRRLWAGETGMAVSRSTWAARSATVISEPSYVNVAGAATIDVTTRQLTVDLEAYYTANSPASTNKYTVMLLQNNVSGPQTSGAAYNPSYINPDGSYRHMHMLRDVLNSTVLGNDITTTTMGSTFTNQIVYTIPASYTSVVAELVDLEVVIFITESNTNIITAARAPITFVGFATANNAHLTNVTSIPATCSNALAPSFKFKNEGSATINSAEITYSINGGTPGTFNWTGSLAPLQTADVQLPQTTFTLMPTNTLNIAISAVNGGVDEDATNNVQTLTFNETNSEGETVNLTFDINQDRYGSETTWSIKSSTGTVVATGGPYANLTANGILLQTHQVTVPAMGCYNVEILDSYGDGLNSGYGAGNATLKDGYGNVIWNTNGVFTSQIGRQFRITSNANNVGLDELNAANVKVYPNPTTGLLNVSFEANGQYAISIVDLTGREVASKANSASGVQTVDFDVTNLAKGSYVVTVVSGGVKTTKNVIVQ